MTIKFDFPLEQIEANAAKAGELADANQHTDNNGLWKIIKLIVWCIVKLAKAVDQLSGAVTRQGKTP